MNIGLAAGASGVSAKMIRYYESIGLVEPAGRTDAGYRVYEEDDVHTLRFVKRARTLGFSIEETTALLTLWRDKSRASGDVKSLAVKHVRELEGKIKELQSMVRTLRHLADSCHGDNRPECPILDDLADPGRQADATLVRTNGKKKEAKTATGEPPLSRSKPTCATFVAAPTAYPLTTERRSPSVVRRFLEPLSK